MCNFNSHIKRFILVVLSALFLGVLTHHSLHQLKHIEDLVCISDDKHFHSLEHKDVCKDLSFFPLSDFNFIEFSFEIKYSEIVLINKVNVYCSNLIFGLNNKSPPFVFFLNFFR